MIKKTSLPITLLLCTVIFATYQTNTLWFDEEEIEYQPDNNIDLDQMLDNGTRTIDPIQGIGTIIYLHLEDYLRVPFYFYTQPPRRRALTDQAYLQFPDYTNMHTIKIVPIAEACIEQRMADDHSNLEYYVDLKQRFFVEILNNIVGPIDPTEPGSQDEIANFPNIPEILSLIAPLKTQEYRLGFDFQYFKDFNDVSVFVQVPFFYQVDNYYLTAQERKNIENYPYIKDFFGEGGDYWEFVRNHFICDKIGWGDTQIFIERTINETYKSHTNIGLEVTIPTGFALKKGLIGTSFKDQEDYPSFNLLNDYLSPGIDLQMNPDHTYNQPLIIDNATNLSLAILDRLSKILLDQPIGMQHFIIGIFTRTQMIFTPRLDLTSKTGITCQLPGNETRYIRHSIKEAIAVANKIASFATEAIDDAQAVALIKAFDLATLQHFFPLPYKTKVFPGFFFESYSQLTYHGDRWTFYAGSNTWWAFMNERFLTIDASPLELAQLDTSIAKNINAYQSRLFIGADKNPYAQSPWTFGFRISGSSLSWNIGPNVSIAGLLRYEF